MKPYIYIYRSIYLSIYLCVYGLDSKDSDSYWLAA